MNTIAKCWNWSIVEALHWEKGDAVLVEGMKFVNIFRTETVFSYKMVKIFL
jgi:hypothetical protein